MSSRSAPSAVSSEPRMIAITSSRFVEGDREALEDVGALLRLGEVVGRPPDDDLAVGSR